MPKPQRLPQYGLTLLLILTATALPAHAEVMPPLVSPGWVAEQLGADDLVVIDATVKVEFDDTLSGERAGAPDQR